MSDHIVAIYPPWKPASGLVLCSGNVAIDDDRSCSDTAPLSLLLADGSPAVEKSSRIIIRRRRADSASKWEHLRDLASTSLWPSMVRLLSMLQPLAEIGIFLIYSSRLTKVSGVEGNSESAAVFTG